MLLSLKYKVIIKVIKYINEDLALAIVINYKEKALELINKRDNFNYICNNKTTLELILGNNRCFLILFYTSNAEEVKDKKDRNGLIISAYGSNIDVFNMLVEEQKLDINYEDKN